MSTPKIRVFFEPRDIWVGVFWDTELSTIDYETMGRWYKVYICILPCLPILITWRRDFTAYDDSGAM